MLKRLPPVSTIYPLKTALRVFKADSNAVSILENRLAEMFGGESAIAFNSGRAALAAVLRMIAATRRGKGVIVPAYFCYSVAAAIAKAGMRIYPADILPETLNYDYKDRVRPPPDDVVAVISPGLFGIPADMPELLRICEPSHLFVIEDAAQSLGATVDGIPAGSFGDVSLFSFSKGKPAGALGGGVLVTRGRALGAAMKNLAPEPNDAPAWKIALKSLAAAVALRPRIFSVVRLMPFVRLGQSIFDPGFKESGLDSGCAALAGAVLDLAESVIETRKNNARLLFENLEGMPGILIPRPREGIVPAYLRFPLIFEDPADRDAVIFELTTRGLGASAMYPKAIHKVKEAHEYMKLDLRPFPGAEKIARGIMTLPTQAGVTKSEIAKMAKIIRNVTTAGA